MKRTCGVESGLSWRRRKREDEEGGGIRVWGGGRDEMERGEVREGKREMEESEWVKARERDVGSKRREVGTVEEEKGEEGEEGRGILEA